MAVWGRWGGSTLKWVKWGDAERRGVAILKWVKRDLVLRILGGDYACDAVLLIRDRAGRESVGPSIINLYAASTTVGFAYVI